MSGLTPPKVLSYEGQVVVPFINRTFDPKSSNYQFDVPTIWINTASETGFILIGKPMNVANWFPFAGGSVVVEKFALQAGTTPVGPLGAIITFQGGVVAAGSVPVQTNGTGANTMALQVQTSQAIASTDATKIGLAAFNSAQFSVDANGFVSSTAITGVSSVTGTANQISASPTTGNVVLSLIGPYTPATYTAHGVLIGEGTGSIVAVADTAASGIPLISQSGADPVFGTALVSGGGTGNISATAYALLAGGTTSTGAHQSLTTGTSGQILQSGGSSALPTWINNSASGNLVLIQSQTASSSASISFTTGITSTYNTYLFVISNLSPATANQPFEMVISSNGGSSYASANYLNGFVNNGGSNSWSGSTVSTFFRVGGSPAVTSQPYANTLLWCFNVTNGNDMTINSEAVFNNNSTYGYEVSFGGQTSITTINAFKFLFPSGNIATGTFTLYGVLE